MPNQGLQKDHLRLRQAAPTSHPDQGALLLPDRQPEFVEILNVHDEGAPSQHSSHVPEYSWSQ